MTGWIWIEADDAIVFHDEQIATHGGMSGLRDRGLLESALSRPRMKAEYGESDVSLLAAAYGYGLASNYPFLDGNKRTALVVMETFLVLHGHELAADNAEVVAVILSLAAGEISEHDLALWVRSSLKPFNMGTP